MAKQIMVLNTVKSMQNMKCYVAIKKNKLDRSPFLHLSHCVEAGINPQHAAPIRRAPIWVGGM